VVTGAGGSPPNSSIFGFGSGAPRFVYGRLGRRVAAARSTRDQSRRSSRPGHHLRHDSRRRTTLISHGPAPSAPGRRPTRPSCGRFFRARPDCRGSNAPLVIERSEASLWASRKRYYDPIAGIDTVLGSGHNKPPGHRCHHQQLDTLHFSSADAVTNHRLVHFARSLPRSPPPDLSTVNLSAGARSEPAAIKGAASITGLTGNPGKYKSSAATSRGPWLDEGSWPASGRKSRKTVNDPLRLLRQGVPPLLSLPVRKGVPDCGVTARQSRRQRHRQGRSRDGWAAIYGRADRPYRGLIDRPKSTC